MSEGKLLPSLLATTLALMVLTACSAVPTIRSTGVLPFATAQAMISAGNFEGALAIYNQQVQNSPDQAGAYAQRASYYVTTRNFDLALADYTQSISLAKTAETLAERCNVYRVLNQPEKATQDCTDSLKLDPNNVDTRLVQATLDMDQNNADAAREQVNQALKINAQSDKAYYVLSQVESKAGELPAAIDALSKAIGINPNSADYFWDRGFLYLATGKVDEAKADMRSVIKVGNPMLDGAVMEKAGSELRIMGEKP